MSEPRFRIGPYWLSQRLGSPTYYATWFDARTRQTKRSSLGTSDLLQAQTKLAEFYVKNSSPTNQKPAEMLIATVLLNYWRDYACNIASSVQTKVALALWQDFCGDAYVSDLTYSRQEEFIVWLKARGYKNAYVSRILSSGRAALIRAWKRQQITSVPSILDVCDRSDAKEPYRLNQVQMRKFLTAVQTWPHLETFCMIMLNTLARPDAVFDLSPAQVSIEDRLINLNPKGRKQTKKFRPKVPLTATLLPYITAKQVDRFVMWRGKPVKSIKKTFALAVQRAGLPSEITPYSLRHTMAKELRKRSVPPWEVEGMLGHRRKGVTEDYAVYDPSYLSKGREAIDRYFAELGLPLKPAQSDCVPAACQSENQIPLTKENTSITSMPRMVGGIGIEPTTTTMST